MKVDLHNYTILNWLNRIIFLNKLVYNTTIFSSVNTTSTAVVYAIPVKY